MSTTLKQAAQQALEALEARCGTNADERKELIPALRAALEGDGEAQPACYGIRQITDAHSVEEWEDIRTSPDVAREEAIDMMATGRGEIYEVVPLYTAPQPAERIKAQPAGWTITFEDGRDFCRHASILIGAAYVSPEDALRRFSEHTLHGESTFGIVTADARTPVEHWQETGTWCASLPAAKPPEGPTWLQQNTPQEYVAEPEDPCYCDKNNIGEPGVSCGDCPTRDYKQPAEREQASTVPPFNRVAQSKLESLLSDHFKITGYAIEKRYGDSVLKGFIDSHGFVGWWSAAQHPSQPQGEYPLLRTITRDDTAHGVEYVTAKHAREYAQARVDAARAKDGQKP